MAFGLFNAIFGVQDEATRNLQNIQSAANNLAQTFGNITPRLRDLATNLELTAIKSVGVGTNFELLSKNFLKIANSGNISARVLYNLGNQMVNMAGPGLSKFNVQMRNTGNEVLIMAQNLKDAEVQLKETNLRGFQPLRDMTMAGKTGMAQLASGAQGAMLAMSLLQRNIMGVVFSLIFLQFSGFAKTTLLTGGLILALGAATMALRGMITFGNRLNVLSDIFFILTNNTTAFRDAMLEGRRISNDLGIEATGDFLKIAEQIEKLGKNSPQEINGVLVSLEILRKNGLLPGVGSTEDLVKRFFDLRDEGKSVEEIIRILNPALITTGNAQEELRKEIERFKQTDTGKEYSEISKAQQEFKDSLTPLSRAFASTWSDIKLSIIRAGTGILNILNADWKEGAVNIIKGFGNLAVIALDSVFVAPVGTMIKKSISDIKSLFDIQFVRDFGSNVISALSEFPRTIINLFTNPINFLKRQFQEFVLGIYENALSLAGLVNRLSPGNPIDVNRLQAIIRELRENLSTSSRGSGPGSGRVEQTFTFDFSGASFSGNPQRDGSIIASNIMRNLNRNGSLTNAPLFAG